MGGENVIDKLWMGTAQWGWTMPKAACFALLDAFYQSGGRQIDAATNYPINKIPEDFRAAETIIHQWISAHGIHDLRVMMKIGSVNNMRTPECNLEPGFLLFNYEYYLRQFGKNLHCLSLHWDNRDAPDEIAFSLSTLADIQREGIKIGLSGIKHPDVYARILSQLPIESPMLLQAKHNVLASDYARYAPLMPFCQLLAYGTNAGGLKLHHEEYGTNATLLARGGTADSHTPLLADIAQSIQEAKVGVSHFYQVGLLYAAYHPHTSGIILGCSGVPQWHDNLQWMQTIAEEDFSALYHHLTRLTAHAN